MTPTATVVGVTTGDAAPAVAPHRISSKAGKSTASVSFTPTHDGVLYPSDALLPEDDLYPGAAAPIVAYIVRVGGTTPDTGRPAGGKSGVCSALFACSQQPCGWSSPSGAAIAEDVTFVEASDGGADGDRTVNVHVLTRGQGWS